MRLDEALPGEKLSIKAILSQESAIMAVRMGIAEGETIRLASKVPGGPLVVSRGSVEIALGREICRDIEVERQ